MDPAFHTAIEAEMMVHVPLFLHANPKRILLVGGDTLAMAREVHRHSSVEKCARVLDLPKDHFDVIAILDESSEGDCQKMKTLLSPGGILVIQAGSPFTNGDSQAGLARELKKHFKRVHFYNIAQPTESGGLTSLAYATDSVHPVDDLSRSKVAASGLDFLYYNLGIHEAAFLLPEFQKKI